MFHQIMQLVRDVREANLPLWLVWVIGVAATIGLFDAGYLSYQHIATTNNVHESAVICVIGAPGSCNTVLESQYATVFNMPLAFLGVIYYLTILALLIRISMVRDVRIWYALQLVITLGFVASLYFVYLQLFVIRSICFYCMVSATMSTVMFGSLVWRRITS